MKLSSAYSIQPVINKLMTASAPLKKKYILMKTRILTYSYI